MAQVENTRVQNWSARRVAGATLIVVAVAAGFWLAFRFHNTLFVLFVAIVLGVAIRPAVDWLYRRGLPKPAGVILVYLGLLAFLAGFLWLAVPLIIDQGSNIVARLPGYYATFREMLRQSGNRLIQNIAAQMPTTMSMNLPTLAPAPAPVTDTVAQLLGYLRQLGHGFLTLIAILLLAFYWTLDGERLIRTWLVRLPPAERDRTRDMISTVENKVGAYIRGVSILCSTVGLLAMTSYFIIGLPYAFVLGLMAGVLEAVPILGPILGAFPAVLLALSLEPGKVIWVIVATVIIQQFENNLLVPRVMDKSVGVHPILTILALAGFSAFLGLAGALMAIPMAAIIQVLFNRYVLGPEALEEPQPQGRGGFSLLRLETQELVQDVRKQIRQKQEISDAKSDDVEDGIEAIATDLDSLLAQSTRQEAGT